MTYIVKYQKVIADGTMYQLAEPDGAERCTEIATVAGVTYVAIPAGVTLPTQPRQITVTKVQMTPAIKARLKSASPAVKLINTRVVDRIRAQYSATDEIQLLWAATGTDVEAYRAHVSAAVSWGQAEKAKLGLGPTA